MRLVVTVLVVEPSPKFQNRLVILPVDRSVKLTMSGFKPAVGVAEKLAASGTMPAPVTGLVLLPLLLEKMITLLELLLAVGLKLTTTLVEAKAGRMKGVPVAILNGPAAPIAATPLIVVAPPKLVRTKLA